DARRIASVFASFSPAPRRLISKCICAHLCAHGPKMEDEGMSVSQLGANFPASSSVMAAATANVNPVSRPLFMPETFTGVGREWSDWSEQFEMAAQVNGWNDELKLKFMSLLFSGRARDIYGGLPSETSAQELSLFTGKLEGAGTVGQMPAPTAASDKLASVSTTGAGVFLTGKIGGCETRLLIDTGAQVSIVPKQFWLNVTNGGSSLDGYQGRVAVANGGEMSILGRWQTVCQFDSLAVIAEFLVADVTPQELLLGTDFLSKFGAVIDLGEKCCRLMGKKLPLFSEDGSVQ
uniref:Peptidase A2 domain-containing protein n=2 Tax=Cyprinus carpio TaxID=7962 RepID=A0A8C1LF44_CYPCA